MTAVLGDEFGGLQAVRGKLDAIAVFLQHPANEFAHADGVVSDDDNAFLFDAIDGVGGNRAASNGCGARREYPCRTRAGLHGAAFVWFSGDHAIQIDQQNQAAVGSDGGSREEFYAPQILAEILDNDFIFAEDFFNNEPDLTVTGIGHYHAEIAVDGLQRWQSKIRIEAND